MPFAQAHNIYRASINALQRHDRDINRMRIYFSGTVRIILLYTIPR